MEKFFIEYRKCLTIISMSFSILGSPQKTVIAFLLKHHFFITFLIFIILFLLRKLRALTNLFHQLDLLCIVVILATTVIWRIKLQVFELITLFLDLYLHKCHWTDLLRVVALTVLVSSEICKATLRRVLFVFFI